MKKLLVCLATLFLLLNVNAYSAENNRSLLEKILNRDLPGGAASKAKKKQNTSEKKVAQEQVNKKQVFCKQVSDKSLLETILRRDLPGGNGLRKKKCVPETTNPINTNISNTNLSLYTGTFDLIDKEGDDQTNLFGIEHRNPNLFRETLVGKIAPISGGFVTGKSSVYLYTGIEGQYDIGPIKILPSFAPGYYQKGDGKDLGSVLEFKSEVKIGFDIFENSQLGYSYSHISNNDWGKTNPGTDNQQITFSKNF
tara:strand:+ start:50 stop:808 length:759 start_codon:yes stop_codon:yes gene_type:complete